MMTECDTLLLLGAAFAWAQVYPQKATLIQVDRDGSHLGRRHPIDLGVVGEVIPTLEVPLAALEASAERSFLDELLEHRCPLYTS
ncbi:ubiquinone-dependent pyruvate dehydrogenase, partial [Pseudomonas aeruginosa]|nr:ubiquinone-dependent pyruvate dehydrogenase [Pseudomonas aeruginosa]